MSLLRQVVRGSLVQVVVETRLPQLHRRETR